jgi:hypothetical protein
MPRICGVQNSHDQEHTIDIVEIPKQRAFEVAEEPEPEPTERTMTVFRFTDGL